MSKPDDTIVTYRASELWEMRRQFLQAGANAELERIIKAVTNASTQIADLYWYRDAGRPEEAFEFLLSAIKGENK